MGPLIWYVNAQVRMWIILDINYKHYYHLGKSQICAGAGDYFRTSKPHSEKLWIVIAMITFHWLTSDCHHECIDPVTDDEVHLTRNLSSAASIMLTLTGRFIEDMTDNLYLNILNDYK